MKLTIAEKVLKLRELEGFRPKEVKMGWDWDSNFEAVRDYAKREGKLPSRKSKDIKVKRLGMWCQRQRSLRRKGQLSKERQKKLEIISIWYWEDGRWDSNFEAVRDYAKREGKLPFNESKDFEVRKLGYWCSKQRRLRRVGKLSKERRKKLETIKVWYWDVDNEGKWDFNFEAAGDYAEKEGKLPSSSSKDVEIRKLGEWCDKQRRLRRVGKLSQERQKKLETISIWDWGEDYNDSWDSNFEAVRDYAEKEGKLPPQRSKNIEVKKLGTWCNYQRNLRRRGKLSEERQKKLETISIWWWDEDFDGKWDSNFKQTRDYVKKEGKLPSIYSRDIEVSRLGQWCNSQRIFRRAGKLSKERQEKLMSIKGWYWDK